MRVVYAPEVIRDITNNIRNLEIFPKMGQVIVHISRVLNEKQEFMRILYGITEE